MKNKYLAIFFLSVFIIKDEGFADTMVMNPNKTTPLSAVYKLTKTNSVDIEVTIKGKTPEMDIKHIFLTGTIKDIPIHGLYPDMTNTVILKMADKEITNFLITEKVEFKKGKVSVDLLPTPDPANQDLYFVNHIRYNLPEDDRNFLIAYDRKGDIRYLNYNHKLHYMFQTDQQILMKNNNGIFDLLNNRLVNYKGTYDLQTHHDSLFLNDNKHLVLADSKWGIEDRIIELDDKGEILKDLSFGSLFRDIITSSQEIKIMNKIIFDSSNIYFKNGKRKGIDWAHANSVVYDEEQDIMYFSLRQQGVLAVDYSEWKLIWWMTDNTLDTIHDGVPNRGMNFLDLKSLEPYRVKGDAVLNGPKNQHALFLFKNGNLGMFDNVGDAEKSDKGSRYIEYQITGTPNNWQAKLVREYKDDSLYSQITSDIDLVGNNHENLLITWGIPEHIREINQQNEIIFDLNVSQKNFLYRADKKPLYPYQNEYKKYSLDANEKSKNPY